MELMKALGISSGILSVLRFVLDVLPKQVRITIVKEIASKRKKSLLMAYLPFLQRLISRAKAAAKLNAWVALKHPIWLYCPILP
jgi:hypothetical protein